MGAVHLAALERLAAGEGVLALPGGAEAVSRGGVLTMRAAEAASPAETVLREGENPFGAAHIAVSRRPMEGGLALRCGPGQVLTARCWRRDDQLTLADSRGAAERQAAAGRAGRDPGEDGRPSRCSAWTASSAAVWGVGTDRKFLPETSGENIYYIIMGEN